MADSAEETAGLPDGSIRLKWPNDLVVETAGPRALLGVETDPRVVRDRLDAPVELRKLGGVLGESDGLGMADPRVIVGIGVNADWSATAFPPDLADSMTSLRAASADRPVDREVLLDGFLARLEPRLLALRDGRFALDDWTSRQATTGRLVRLAGPEHDPGSEVRALGVDPVTGGLVVEDTALPGGERIVLAGDVDRVRLTGGSSDASARTARVGV